MSLTLLTTIPSSPVIEDYRKMVQTGQNLNYCLFIKVVFQEEIRSAILTNSSIVPSCLKFRDFLFLITFTSPEFVFLNDKINFKPFDLSLRYKFISFQQLSSDFKEKQTSL